MQGDVNMKKGIWKNEEVKDLFKTVEEIKNSNKSLRVAFARHAAKYSRKPNSVRNYYYHEVDNLKDDKTRLKQIGIDLSKHEKNEIKYFSQEEEDSIMHKIDAEVKNGVSVRKACFNLSGGDVELMLRYQNKYRNFLAKHKGEEKQNNIIKFTQKRTIISDAEIQALFMGLVRLVKKNAVDEANSKMLNSLEKTNIELRKTIIELQSKEHEIERLKKEFARIKQENTKLLEGAYEKRSERAEKLREKLKSREIKTKIYN